MAIPGDSLLLTLEPAGGGEVLPVPWPGDVRWSIELPGGHKTLSCTVRVPAGTPTPAALASYSHVRVTDRRTGRTCWFGRLTDPGLTVETGSQEYAVTAEGEQLVADGWREVYGLVDRAQESWQGVGDFSGASTSFGGGFAPPDYLDLPGDYTWDPGGGFDNIDFPGDFPGMIDFSPVDYPSPADYPGYLGFLNPDWGGLGSRRPVPGTGGGDWSGSDTDFWPGWLPGITQAGDGTATVTSGRGRLTSGTTSGSRTSRRRISPASARMWDGSTLLGHPETPTHHILSAVAEFSLQTSGATAEVWLWGDPTLSTDGVVLQVGTSGTISVVRLVAGTPTTIGSWSGSVTTSTSYSAGLLVLGSFVVARVWTGTVAEPWYSPPDLAVDAGTSLQIFSDTNHWAGLGVLGDGTSTSQAVDFVRFRTVRDGGVE